MPDVSLLRTGLPRARFRNSLRRPVQAPIEKSFASPMFGYGSLLPAVPHPNRPAEPGELRANEKQTDSPPRARLRGSPTRLASATNIRTAGGPEHLGCVKASANQGRGIFHPRRIKRLHSASRSGDDFFRHPESEVVQAIVSAGIRERFGRSARDSAPFHGDVSDGLYASRLQLGDQLAVIRE